MTDEHKTREELINELNELRQKVSGESGAPNPVFRDGEKKFRALFEHSPDVVAIVNAEGTILDINHVVGGYDKKVVVGLSLFDLLDDQHKKICRKALRQATESGVNPFYEATIMSPDGNAIRWNNRISALDREKGLFVVVSTDITESWKTEQALRESEERFRQTSDLLPSIVGEMDMAGRLTYVNKLGQDVFGISPNDDEDAPEAISRFIHPDDRERAWKNMASVIQGDDIETHEYRMIAKDGTAFPVVVQSAPIVRDGEVVGIRSSLNDVTKEKELQASIAQSDRLATMGLLAAGVAHELNNPLAFTLYNLESLTEDLPRVVAACRQCMELAVRELGDDTVSDVLGNDRALLDPSFLEDIQSRFHDAAEGSRRIKDITRALGTFTRIDESRLAPVNIGQVVEVAVNMVYGEIRYRARLVRDYQKTPTIMANDGRLAQLFMNLLVNAAHAVEEGDSEGNEIRVRTWHEGDEVVAEIRDTGRGIDKEHLPHLFDPFFTTKEIGIGTGLGLSISRNIVESYGGQIDVTSEVGKGTSFVVRLPITRNEKTPRTSPTKDGQKSPRVRGRILIVDDEEGIRSLIGRMLRGHDIVEAQSGAEAKALLSEDQSFDLIVSDMMMPGVSGMDLHAWLVDENPPLSERLIFITGGAFTDRAREYLRTVENLRLEKPFDTANFRKIVNEMLRTSRREHS